MIRKTFLLCITFLMISCTDSNNETNCAAVLCATQSNYIYVEFLDGTTNENLIDKGNLSYESFQIKNEENEEVAFTIGEYSNLGKSLNIPVSTDLYGDKSFQISWNDGNPLTISLTTSLENGTSCCGPYTGIENVMVSNYTNDFTDYGLLPLEVIVYTN